ncbi:MAG: hypothetical protein NDJ94_14585 [Vicinamibacteria bacterium]|nr:hypothetical protein [Vicinamibacteria bacterium]
MKRRVVHLGCPACGGRLPRRASLPGPIACPSCGSPLVTVASEASARSLLRPQVSADEARAAALVAWRHPLAPPGFPGRPETPRLLYVALWEVERTVARPRARAGEDPLLDVRSRELSFWRPELGLTDLDCEAVLDAAGREPFDLDTVGDAIVLDPVRSVRDAAPPAPGVRVLEERAEVVHVPLWRVRCRHRGDAWEAVVDATSGRVLCARAPVERSARLGAALALLVPLALLAGAPPAVLRFYGELLVRTQLLFVLALLFVVAGCLSEAWDRIRFRHEWRVEGPRTSLVAVNRPDETRLQWLARLPFRLLNRPLLTSRE